MKLLPQSLRTDQPWRNGHGLTSEVASEFVDRGSDLSWRIAIATIDHDSSFSRYNGIDRHLMPLGPDSLTLEVGGAREEFAVHSVASFPGEAVVEAVDVSRPGRDLNVMIARAFGEASLVKVDALPGTKVTAQKQGMTFVLALDAGLALGRVELAECDAVLLAPGEGVDVSGFGRLAVIRIRARDHL